MNVHVAIFLLFLTSYSQSVSRGELNRNRIMLLIFIQLEYKAVTTSFIPRTCQEGFESGHPDMQETGMYWIDPDGQGIGSIPIYVLCEKGVADKNGGKRVFSILMNLFT